MKKYISLGIATIVLCGMLMTPVVNAQTIEAQSTINTSVLQQILNGLIAELIQIEVEYAQIIATQATSTPPLTQGNIGTATSTTSSTHQTIIASTTAATSTQVNTPTSSLTQIRNEVSTITITPSTTASVQAPTVPVMLITLNSKFAGATYSLSKGGGNNMMAKIASFLVTNTSTVQGGSTSEIRLNAPFKEAWGVDSGYSSRIYNRTASGTILMTASNAILQPGQTQEIDVYADIRASATGTYNSLADFCGISQFSTLYPTYVVKDNNGNILNGTCSSVVMGQPITITQ